MTTIAAGSSATITIAANGSVAVATNGGMWTSTATPTVGNPSTISHGPVAHTRIFGPYVSGAALVLKNQTVDSFVYVDYEQVAPSSAAVAVGSPRTVTLGDKGTVVASSSGGFWKASVTPAVGSAYSNVYGPQAGATAFGPFDIGATVVLTNQTSPALASVAVNVSGPAVIVLPNATSMAGMGNSITYGYNLAQGRFPANQRFLDIVAAALGAGTPLNQGVPGTVLQDSNDSSGSPRAQNMRGRFVTDTLGANKRDMIVLSGGFNDARYIGAPSTFNVTAYGVELRQMLAGYIIGGYATNKIVCVSPFYITDTGLTTGSAGFTGQSRAGFLAFVTEMQNAAREYGVWFCDAYTYMLNNGAGTLIDPADNIHPLASGHAVIATAILYASTQQNTNAAAALTVTPGQNTLGYSITPVSGAISYTLEYGADGSYAFPNTQTVSASGTLTSVTAGTYRVRARANFGDGTSTPWGFSASPATVTDAVVPGIFLQQTFSGTPATAITATTPTTGGSWATQTGYTPATPVALDSAGTGLFSPTSTGVYQNAATPSGADYYVEAVLNMVSTVTTPTNDNVGVIIRADTAANTLYFARYLVGSGWQLFKTVAGTSTQLGTTQVDVWTTGNRTMRATVTGTTIAVSVGGTQIISVTDSSITAAGKAGIRFGAVQSSTTGIHMVSIVAST